MPMPDGTYWVAKMGDKPVGGLFDAQRPAVRAVPESWMSYIAVDDVDARVKKAQSLGAKLMRPIFDVPGVGRIAILTRAGRRRHRLDDAGCKREVAVEYDHATYGRFARRMAGRAQGAARQGKGIQQGTRSR